MLIGFYLEAGEVIKNRLLEYLVGVVVPDPFMTEGLAGGDALLGEVGKHLLDNVFGLG